MIHQLSIDDFLKHSMHYLTLDVRSEAEFNYGHIPNATNLPLFNNEERKTIGITYKQKSKEEAVLEGLDIVGPKMAGFLRFARPLVSDNKVFIHCWRGGMRSGSMAWLFNFFGYEVFTLKGGYKSYRHHVLDVVARPYKYLVLGGRTGSGKTEILHALRQLGEQVINLEGIANHKGSAFGSIGQAAQPSTEHFENLMAVELQKTNANKRVWIEDESRSIGKVFLDLNLWKHKVQAPVYVVDLPAEIRLKKLVQEYGCFSREELKTAFTNIMRRLGNEQWKNAIRALEENQIEQAADIALHYYDKAYDKALLMKEAKDITRFAFESGDPMEIATTLKAEADKKYGS